MTAIYPSHFALRVEDLKAAETFYTKLFGLEVGFREAAIDGKWFTLPDWADWSDAERAGVTLDIVFLMGGDAFSLALERSASVDRGGPLSHLAIGVPPDELASIKDLAEQLGATVTVWNTDDWFELEDPYGVQWELHPAADGPVPPNSNGAARDQWLEV